MYKYNSHFLLSFFLIIGISNVCFGQQSFVFPETVKQELTNSFASLFRDSASTEFEPIVLNSTTFKFSQEKDSVTFLRLRPRGFDYSFMVIGFYGDIESGIFYNSGAFMPECGTPDFNISDISFLRIDKQPLIKITEEKWIRTCYDVDANKVKTAMYYQVNKNFEKAFEFEDFYAVYSEKNLVMRSAYSYLSYCSDEDCKHLIIISYDNRKPEIETVTSVSYTGDKFVLKKE